MSSSRALIPEPPLLVLPSLALAVGLNEAIVLQQLHFLATYRRPGRDGYNWVEMGSADLQHTFPFLSRNTLWRAINSLRTEGLIVVKESSGQPNAYRLDHQKITDLVTGKAPRSNPTQNGEGTQSDTLPNVGRDHAQNGVGTLPNMGSPTIKEVLDSKKSIQQGAVDKSTKAKALAADWTPSESCQQQLLDAGHSLQFIRQVLPEFRMYWSSKGEAKDSWDAVFALHVRSQSERKAQRDRGVLQEPTRPAPAAHPTGMHRPASVETQQGRQPPAAEVIKAFTPTNPLSAEENRRRFEQLRRDVKI